MDNTFVIDCQRICREIKDGLPQASRWEWDGRFDTAVTAFEKKDSASILALLRRVFAQQWDAQTIANAPKNISRFVESAFEIHAGQLVFTTDERSGFLLLAAWWPWGNGTTISLRMGMYCLANAEPRSAELSVMVRGCFLGDGSLQG